MGAENLSRRALQLILLMGLVSALGDVTYEGARSISGPYLALLGAGAGAVGFVSGLGEFLGYGVRLASGYLADRTRLYWPFTVAGYALLLAVPLLALAGDWRQAALFLLLERAGKGLRAPARDTIISHAARQVGRGWGFGIHEALDPLGAVAGPLLGGAVLLSPGAYRRGLALLGIPALLTLAFVLTAWARFPRPAALEGVPENVAPRAGEKGRGSLPTSFWFYLSFSFLAVLGFAHYQLLAYHFRARQVVSEAAVPLFYALAMGVDGAAALLAGKAYDRRGMKILFSLPLLTLPLPFLVFSGSRECALAGVVLWGWLLGVQETVMRAGVADLVPPERRALAYGVFNAGTGLAMFLGGTALGFLYARSPALASAFILGTEFLALLLLAGFWRQRRRGEEKGGGLLGSS